MTWVACHPVGQRRRLRADPQALARFTARLPAGRFDEDHVDRVVGHHGATLGRGPRDGAPGLEDLAARRSRGGPETPGSEGAQPPASLARGHAECGPSEYAACLRNAFGSPAPGHGDRRGLRTPPRACLCEGSLRDAERRNLVSLWVRDQRPDLVVKSRLRCGDCRSIVNDSMRRPGKASRRLTASSNRLSSRSARANTATSSGTSTGTQHTR